MRSDTSSGTAHCGFNSCCQFICLSFRTLHTNNVCHLMEPAGDPRHACRYTSPATPNSQLTSAGTSGIHSRNLVHKPVSLSCSHFYVTEAVGLIHPRLGALTQVSHTLTSGPQSRLTVLGVCRAGACRRPPSQAASWTPCYRDQSCPDRPHRTLFQGHRTGVTGYNWV